LPGGGERGDRSTVPRREHLLVASGRGRDSRALEERDADAAAVRASRTASVDMSCSSASSAIDAAIVGTVVPRSKFPERIPYRSFASDAAGSSRTASTSAGVQT